MKKISTLLVAGSLAAFSAPAMAQDNSSNFDGFRVQGVLGYDALKAGSSVDDDANEDNDQSIDGAVYGIQAGYDFDLGGAVVGLEAELTDSSAETEFTNGDFEGFGFGQVDAGRDLFLGARVGAK
ncbi:MAG: autotransporter outer membrane beta-barrel domain-containing protein, partial [Pelagibaca sp.]|nr:autotransporter outer membrane beta-barrel domain-containing protein [Pelagibaca sp.]